MAEPSPTCVRCHHTSLRGRGAPRLGASTAAVPGADSSAVTETERGGDGGAERGGTKPRLRAIDGPLHGSPPPPPVRLVREFKGLTVADLLRDELVERLPGQVRSALHHAERGDWRAAEQALPGEFAPLLPGPGHERGRLRPYAIALAVLGAALGVAIASWAAG